MSVPVPLWWERKIFHARVDLDFCGISFGTGAACRRAVNRDEDTDSSSSEDDSVVETQLADISASVPSVRAPMDVDSHI